MLRYRRRGNVDSAAAFRAAIDNLIRDHFAGVSAAPTPPATSSASAPVGGFHFNPPSAAVSAHDQDLKSSYASHVTQSVLLNTGLPVITPAAKVDDVFGFVEDSEMVGALIKVRPGGAVYAHIIAQCVELDPVPYICAHATRPKGASSPWIEAGALLEQACAVARDRTRDSRRPMLGSGSGYLRELRRLRECYGFLISPANASKLPQSASDASRLDRLFFDDIWRALDCSFNKSPVLGAATNAVELLLGVLQLLGFDDDAATI